MLPEDLAKRVIQHLVDKADKAQVARVSSNTKLLNFYKQNSNTRFALDFQETMAVLEAKGLVTLIRYSDKTSIKSITLKDYDLAIKWIGHTPLKDKIDAARISFNNSISSTEYQSKVLNAAVDKWQNGYAFLSCTVDEVEKLIEITNAGIAALKVKDSEQTIDYRHFGAHYLSHSKSLSEIKGKLCDWLNLFGTPLLGLSHEEILHSYGIVKLNHPVYLFGPVKLSDGSVDIDCRFTGGVGVKGNFVNQVNSVQNIQTLTTIENKATFDRYIEHYAHENELVMFTSGIPSPEFLKLYLLINVHCQPNKVQHWGDIDLGGFTILHILESSLNMSIESMFLKPEFYSQHYGEFTTKDETLILNLLSSTNLSAATICIQSGHKYEQESFLWDSLCS